MSNLLISFHKHSAFSACQADGIIFHHNSPGIFRSQVASQRSFSAFHSLARNIYVLRITYKCQAFGVPTCRIPTFHSAPGVKHHRFTTNLWGMTCELEMKQNPSIHVQMLKINCFNLSFVSLSLYQPSNKIKLDASKVSFFSAKS